MILSAAPATNPRCEELMLPGTVLSDTHLTSTTPQSVWPEWCRAYSRTTAWLEEGPTVWKHLEWTTILTYRLLTPHLRSMWSLQGWFPGGRHWSRPMPNRQKCQRRHHSHSETSHLDRKTRLIIIIINVIYILKDPTATNMLKTQMHWNITDFKIQHFIQKNDKSLITNMTKNHSLINFNN